MATDPVTAELPERVIGHIRMSDGPTLIIVGGLHGNEPAGVEALHRVCRRLRGMPGAVKGEVMALVGNRTALARGVRFADTDLNRGWWPEAVEGPATGYESVEDRERREIMSALEPVLDRARKPPVVVDLHTASGEAPPFLTVGDTLRNRRLAGFIPLPMVLGLEEMLAATFLEYVNGLGCVTLGFEGGRHGDPAAVDHLEAGVWILLAAVGVIPWNRLPSPDPREVLEAATRGQPQVAEIRYRHAIPRGRTFTMAPGYRSFQPVAKGEELGTWGDGSPVVAPEKGRILMPLYQPQGDDGFFITRDVHRFWLWVSTALRKLRTDRVAPLLPGVRPHPYIPGAVLVDRRVARWYTVEIFHLLGFRREVEQGHVLVMSRRHFDAPDDWF